MSQLRDSSGHEIREISVQNSFMGQLTWSGTTIGCAWCRSGDWRFLAVRFCCWGGGRCSHRSAHRFHLSFWWWSTVGDRGTNWLRTSYWTRRFFFNFKWISGVVLLTFIQFLRALLWTSFMGTSMSWTGSFLGTATLWTVRFRSRYCWH